MGSGSFVWHYKRCMRRHVLRILAKTRPRPAPVLALLLFFPALALGQELPKWEAGIGVALLNIPDYRGSDKQRTYVLPLPYLVYRGETVMVDKEGAHADVFKTDRVKLDLSLSAGPPAESSEDGARSGMQDIDPTLEGGPALKVRLTPDRMSDYIWSLRFPLHAVVATDLAHYRFIGWSFSPYLNFDAFNLGPRGGWNLGVAVGPLYASEAYHDYYYEVAPEYATATRPAYDARGGYNGSRVTMALSKRFNGYWIGGFVRYDNLAGAVFEDSPVVRKKESWMLGVGISWIYSRSAERVYVPPEVEQGRY